MPAESLPIKIASRLECDIVLMKPHSLPPLRKLAREYGVSWPTMSKALKLLEKKGILKLQPRRRASLASAEQAIRLEPGTSADHIYSHFRTQIESGSIEAGRPLPKILHIAQKYQISNRTAASAYRLLVQDGFAYRKGRTWVAGRDRVRAVSVRNTTPQVILILSKSSWEWGGICDSRRTELFGQAFLREKERLDIRLLPVVHTPTDDQSIPTGMQAVKARIRELGNRYLGTLLIDKLENFPEMQNWITSLAYFKRPIVWFDRINQKLPDMGRPSSSFFRCHYDEDAANRVALEFLYSYGHRRIVYAYQEKYPWHEQRLRSLQNQAAQSFTDMQIFGSPIFPKECWANPGSGGILEIIKRLETMHHLRFHTALKYFSSRRNYYQQTLGEWIPSQARDSSIAAVFGMTLAPEEIQKKFSPYEIAMRGAIWAGVSLRDLYFQKAGTLVGPNDVIARGYHLNWLLDLGLRAPDHVSVLSYDNVFRKAFFGLSSVDMGFERLGYLAFRAIAGDVPVRAGRNGDIPISPFVVDNGSVGQAKNGMGGLRHEWYI